MYVCMYVSINGLLNFLLRLGCAFPPPPPHPKLILILRPLHDEQMVQLKCNGSFSESLLISNGVKEGCVLAPSLISIFFSMMLREAKDDFINGIYIRFRIDGSLFILRGLLAKTKVVEEFIKELLFADDCPLLAHCFSEAAKVFRLTFSLEKTEVLCQPLPDASCSLPKIKIDATNLNAVEHFTNLGSIISNDATVTKDLEIAI